MPIGELVPFMRSQVGWDKVLGWGSVKEWRTGDDDDFVLDSSAIATCENCSIRRLVEESLRSGRVACYAPDLGYVFECAGVGHGCGELRAERLQSLLGYGRHDGLFAGVRIVV